MLGFLTNYVSAGGHSFTTFSSGTITGGAAAVSQSMNVSGLSGTYLFYVVTGDFVGGADPAWSNTIQMGITGGAGVEYKSLGYANAGAAASSANTTLKWTGVLFQPYSGGNTLNVQFADSYDDASGTYTSTLNNVSVTIYVSPTPENSFSSFSSGTITGGAAAVSHSMNVSGLSGTCLFYVLTGDFVGGADPAWSNTIQMGITGGAGVEYKSLGYANAGAAASDANTTLKWTGVLFQPYSGGNTLKIEFADSYDDASGTYTSTLNNVSFSIYSEPAPEHTFASYSSGTITGGAAAVSQSQNVSGLTGNYLFYVVTGDFVGGADPAWSNTIQMGITGGAGVEYKSLGYANAGAAANSDNTTLKWTGVLFHAYTGGNALNINFADSYDDASGTYTSTLNNVSVTLYSETSALVLSAAITSSTHIACNGAGTGSLTVTATDGTANYDYLWSNGASTNNTSSVTNTISSLAAGTYTVTITDDASNTATASATITQPAAVGVSITAQSNVACNGSSTGSLTASGSGGTPAYNYLCNRWNFSIHLPVEQ